MGDALSAYLLQFLKITQAVVVPTTDPQTKSRSFFSLKWKAVFLLSLVLITVNIGLVILSYQQLKAQFDTQRTEAKQQQSRELLSLVRYNARDMQNYALALSIAAQNLSKSLPYQERINQVAATNAAILEFDWGLDTLAFIPNNGNLALSGEPANELVHVRDLIDQVKQEEQPIARLECINQCKQYIAVPLLEFDLQTGVLLLGRSVADIVLTFREITGSDLAVIVPEAMPSGTKGSERLLQDWNLKVGAYSRSEWVMPVLRSISKLHTLSQVLRATTRINYSDKTYEVHAVEASAQKIGGIFLILNDVTEEVLNINQATSDSLKAGIFGLLFSEILLLLLLWAPLKRLDLLSKQLPLLAENAFHDVRRRLQVGRKFLPGDEIDLAREATVTLSHRLETLQDEVQSYTQDLESQREELTRERDFITGLVNSAQVMILTQDWEGQLVLLNPEAERATGYKQHSIKQIRFSDLLAKDSITDDLTDALIDLKKGQLDYYQHDCDIISKSGGRRSVSWIHSRLPGSTVKEGGAMMLSVGLDITEREQAKEQLSWLADHDPLTELYNRRRFQREFEKILKFSLRYRRSGALVYFDLDYFKYVNDTSGHQAGDAMLRMVAAILSELIRTTDLLARLGGDEFALVIPETDSKGAVEVAKKILDELQKVEMPVKGRSHRISASIGIVIFPQHGINILDLMANADLAMYQAKEKGRKCWHLFALDEQVREQLDARMQWKEKIEQALADEWLFLVFQPIMWISTGEISHFEVLIRMREPDGTIVMPDAFIPEAEKNGLIHSIDRFVLRASIERLTEFQNINESIQFSINLSGMVMDDAELLPILKGLLEESGVNPHRLMFEVTETAALADIASAKHMMRKIRELGCRFALDDFGTGFSSFFYLRELPVDVVKIDGSFIKQITHNSDDRVFVKAMTEVSSGLGKKTIAEYVEDQETLDLLTEIGVDYAQGYHIGRPASELRV